MRVGIINYGMGNLDSVARAIEVGGGVPTLVDKVGDLGTVAAIVLPGVGAFAHAMANLHDLGMVDALHAEVVDNKIPFLGICLGMQLMAERGFEGRDQGTLGLGWIDGDVVQLRWPERVPHVGWNEVHPTDNAAGDTMFHGLEPGHDFYFVHSYHLDVRDEANRAASTPYGSDFCSAVARDHIWGVQFHPEKSQQVGFAVLQNFLEIAC